MPPRKKRAASAPPKDSTSPLKKAAIEAITCPITRQLVVDPVVAEDENTYESAAIRQWLQSNYRSPMTNERMGDRLTPNRHARLMVEAAVKEEAVPSEDAAQWHISSAKLLASGDVPGGMSSAIEHLREAPKTPETDLLLRCATLRTQMDSLRAEAASLDVQGVDAFFTMPPPGRADGWRPPAGWRPLERFDDTLDGALVRVIPDRDEFQRLCERPAPGAVEAVEWCDDMESMCGSRRPTSVPSLPYESSPGDEVVGGLFFDFDAPRRCGRHYAIEAVYSNSCGYELTKSDTDDTFAVPFDACMFVSRDTSPEFRERFDVYI